MPIIEATRLPFGYAHISINTKVLLWENRWRAESGPAGIVEDLHDWPIEASRQVNDVFSGMLQRQHGEKASDRHGGGDSEDTPDCDQVWKSQ